MAAAVADAHPVVLSAAHWVARAPRRRGRGARTVRRHAARPRRAALMLFRVFTVLAVVALVISTWILSSPARRAVELERSANQADLPGYYLKNAVLTDYDAAGAPSIRIEAERIDQIDARQRGGAVQRPRELRCAGRPDLGDGRRHRACSAGRQDRRCHRQRASAGRESPDTEGTAVIHTDTLRYDVPDVRREHQERRAHRLSAATS